METRYLDDRLLVGNCLDTLKGLEDASIDSIVTDPPYEIGFMGRAWDSTGIAYNVELWAECLRVLKPGGHLLAFGATRSYHRMACAIEDAGFEIRDSIHWTYGSGFPKSHDVSKAIDKAAGATREVVGTAVYGDGHTQNSAESIGYGGSDPAADTRTITAPATPGAKTWQGWGTALKPSHEPIVVARKPLEGTVAANVLEHGTGALNVDECRVGTEGGGNACPGGDECACVTSGVTYSPTKHPVRREGNFGRWPANTILTHAADCCAVCAPGCPVADLDAQSGTLKSGLFKGEAEREVETYGDAGGASRFFAHADWDPEWDRIVYAPKPRKAERNAGLDGLPDQPATGSLSTHPKMIPASGQATYKNTHPTVKPVNLMRHLIRLVTPKGGVILDPFLGSGTTAVAAILEGMDWKGCELTEEYLPIIRGRVQHAIDSTEGQLPFE